MTAMREPVLVADETFLLPATLPVPGRGVQYVNPLLVRGAEPLLVDTGAAVLGDEYFTAVESLIDLNDVRWIFLSHDDRDHTGGLLQLLQKCPAARVITSFQAINRIAKETPIPADRVQFAGIGDSVSIGDRSLHLVRPPLFDSPATRGFWDDRTGLYFAVDAFGAVTSEYREWVGDDSPASYRDGFYWLNYANTPWLDLVDPARLAATAGAVRAVDPSVIVSYHGPAASRVDVNRLVELLLTIPTGETVRFPTLAEVAVEPALGGKARR
jgi:flavorubredoxin